VKSIRLRFGYVPDAGLCPACGKRRYLSRRDAKTFARISSHHKHRGMTAYRCGDFWHLGHLPAGVKSGRYTRDDLARKQAPHPPQAKDAGWGTNKREG
jgi:hypothetical protein